MYFSHLDHYSTHLLEYSTQINRGRDHFCICDINLINMLSTIKFNLVSSIGTLIFIYFIMMMSLSSDQSNQCYGKKGVDPILIEMFKADELNVTKRDTKLVVKMERFTFPDKPGITSDVNPQEMLEEPVDLDGLPTVRTDSETE